MLVCCPANRLQKALQFGEDGVGGDGPGERTGAGVVVLDEGVDAAHQLAHGAEGAAPDRPLMPVPLLALGEYLAGADVQRGEERRGAMPDVAVGHPSAK